ncbi:MAG: diguanylate cyclase [Burkholderiales bacterium]|nr:diguanylate cyclase [Burkholderiales bacterium]
MAAPGAAAPAQLAKAALRRLAQLQQEPTPENYARAYADEGGPPVAAPAAGVDPRTQGAAWAALVERLARNLERGGRQWTGARRKESLQRVLDGSRSDAQRLLQRLQSLMGAWEADRPAEAAETGFGDLPPGAEASPAAAWPAGPPAGEPGPAEPVAVSVPPAAPLHWPPLVGALQSTVRAGLAEQEPRAAELAAELGALADAVAAEGASAERVAAIEAVCARARRLFAHRHRLVEELAALCQALGAGLAELAEDDSWVRGQCESLQARLDADLAQGPSVRGVRAAGAMLAQTRRQQQRVREDRRAAQAALKQLIQAMLHEVGELGDHAGRFQLATARHAEAIERADSLEGLAGVVRAMIDDTRTVQSAVSQSQQRLQADQARAGELEARVRELEAELRRLSDEVSTDALTQVANRRGLDQAFEAESARQQRRLQADGDAAPPLAVGLIDIDNFKRLNDTLGHAAGDVALKSLAAAVRERLRPADHLARFGGEEFVVLLPATALDEARQVLTRLQRSLSEALFLHEGREVFVTFSAGVSAWRSGEPLQTTLERADEALYEAKRTGKNRTCVA